MLAGKKPIGEHAAVWVPDIEAKTCMHCKKNQFTFLNRRVSVWLNSNLAFNHDYLFIFSIIVETVAQWYALPAPRINF